MTIFIPNRVITHEECTECLEPDIKVEHGKDIYNLPMHFEHCPECGDALLILCFDCPDCETEETNDEQNKNRVDRTHVEPHHGLYKSQPRL